MPIKQKLLLVVGIISLGVVVFIIFILPGLSPAEPALGPGGTLPGVPADLPREEKPGSGSQGAFVPIKQASPRPSPGAFTTPTGTDLGLFPAVTKLPDFNIDIPSFEEIRRSVESTFSDNQFLPVEPPKLPDVFDAELVIDPSGKTGTADYLEFVVLNYQNIDFDFKKFNDLVVKDGNPASGEGEMSHMPTLPELIDNGLASGNLAATFSSLSLVRYFLSSKMDFEKSIAVAQSGVPTTKVVIGLDKLSIELIDKFGALASGSITKKEFTNFYDTYKNSTAFYSNEFLKDVGALAHRDKSFFRSVLGLFGLNKVAEAILSVGGIVIWQTWCTCSFFTGIRVAGPAPGQFGMPPFFALFANFMPTWGHFVLGNYAPSFAPCLQFVIIACAPDVLFGGVQGFIYMLGTS